MKRLPLIPTLFIICITCAIIGMMYSCHKEDARQQIECSSSVRTVSSYSYEYIENDLVVYYHENDSIKKYFLVQRDIAPLTASMPNISNVNLSTDGTLLTISYSDNLTTSFSVSGTAGAESCNGISEHIDLSGFIKNKVKDDVLYWGNNPGRGGSGGSKRCKDCLDGGCGSASCSRSVEILGVKKSCSTSCNTGYHACCGDLVEVGCFCQKNICCDK